MTHEQTHPDVGWAEYARLTTSLNIDEAQQNVLNGEVRFVGLRRCLAGLQAQQSQPNLQGLHLEG